MRRICLALLCTLVFSGNVFGQEWQGFLKVVDTNRTGGENFGSGLDIDGKWAITGAFRNSLNEDEDWYLPTNMESGAAFIMEKQCSGWVRTQKLVAPDRALDNIPVAPWGSAGNPIRFGQGVAIQGDYAFVASESDLDEVGSSWMIDAGGIYVFKYDSNELDPTNMWKFHQKIVSPERAMWDNFGSSFQGYKGFSVEGNTLMAGSNRNNFDTSGGNDLSNAGAVFVFQFNTTSKLWEYDQKIVAPATPVNHRFAEDRFGTCVSLSGDFAVISTY